MSITKVALEELPVSLKSDLAHAEKHAADLAKWSAAAPIGYEAMAAAMLLHHLYGAVEAIVERSLKTFDGKVPDGEDSHIRLLEQAAQPIAGVRERILSRSDEIDELRTSIPKAL